MATTVIVAVSLTPSLVATTAAAPSPTPVTSPCASTVATAVLSVVQVITRPGSKVPFESRVVAENRCVVRSSSVADAGVSVTDATGAGGTTVTEAVPLAVPLVAVIVTSPTLTPVTVARPGPTSPMV